MFAHGNPTRVCVHFAFKAHFILRLRFKCLQKSGVYSPDGVSWLAISSCAEWNRSSLPTIQLKEVPAITPAPTQIHTLSISTVKSLPTRLPQCRKQPPVLPTAIVGIKACQIHKHMPSLTGLPWRLISRAFSIGPYRLC